MASILGHFQDRAIDLVKTFIQLKVMAAPKLNTYNTQTPKRTHIQPFPLAENISPFPCLSSFSAQGQVVNIFIFVGTFVSKYANE
jgi:hypothetical protein